MEEWKNGIDGIEGIKGIDGKNGIMKCGMWSAESKESKIQRGKTESLNQ